MNGEIVLAGDWADVEDIDLDLLAIRLQGARLAAGNPSFGEISTRISHMRRKRGLPTHETRIARSTVYDAFRTGRRRLDEDLVVEIVAALGYDQQVQVQWRTMCRHAHVSAAGAPVAGHLGLPEDTAYFTGRESELETLLSSAGPFLISGLGGSGKTALAIHAAHALLESGRADEAHLVDLRGDDPDRASLDPEHVVEVLLRMLGVAPLPIGVEARRAVLAQALGSRQVVVILDNAAETRQITGVVDAAGSGIVLVTSRSRALEGTAIRIDLGPLDEAEGVELLAKIAGSDRVAAELVSAKRLVASTGSLPLALTLVATRVVSQPDWSLADHDARYRELRRQLRIEDSVAAAVGAAYQSASAQARLLLRMFAAQPHAGLNFEALAVLMDQPVEDAEEAAGELEHLHLLSPSIDGGFQIHDVVRTFALGESHDVDRPGDRDAAMARILDHFLSHEPDALSVRPPKRLPVGWAVLAAVLGLGLNLLGTTLVSEFNLSVFLDMIGTAIVAMLVGPWWGASAGVLTNAFESWRSGWGGLYFALVNVAGALLWGYGIRRFRMGRTLGRYLSLSILVAFVSSLIAVPILVLVFGGATDHSDTFSLDRRLGDGLYQAVFTSNIVDSIGDKLIAGLIALVVVGNLSRRFGLGIELPAIDGAQAARPAEHADAA